MLDTTKKQIHEIAPALFNNIPNNCSIISKNFEVIIEQKINEVCYSDLPYPIQCEIERRFSHSKHITHDDDYLSIKKNKI